jgi:hypothetical protein
MGVARSEYPVTRGSVIVRGDPLSIPVTIRDHGVEQDITDWSWRAHIRRSADASLVTEFTFDVMTPDDGAVPCVLVMNLTQDQTRLLRSGMVFDLEQLSTDATPVTIRTWWIVSKLNLVKDISHV